MNIAVTTIAVFGAFAILLSGCAHRFSKEGTTREDLVRQQAKCKMGAASIPIIANQKAYFENCMIADGWSPEARRLPFTRAASASAPTPAASSTE